MVSKIYLWGIGAASVLALASFLAIIWFFSPENAGGFILALLFSSLFLALCGFFSLLGFWARRKKYKDLLLYSLGVSFREGTLLSVLLVGFLIMSALGIFRWWSALIFLITIVGIETGFLYQEKN